MPLTWCVHGQCVHGMSIDDMQVAVGGIVTSFGRHKFVLRASEHLPNVLELVSMVDSSLLIVERTLDLVSKTVAKMAKNLDFVVTVDQKAGRCRNTVEAPNGPLVLISGPRGLQDRLDKGVLDLPVAAGKRLSAAQVLLLFSMWLIPRGLRKKGYDTR